MHTFFQQGSGEGVENDPSMSCLSIICWLVLGIWGTTVLVIDHDAQGECGNVWDYVLLAVITSFMTTTHHTFIVCNAKPNIIITVFSGMLSLAYIIWLFIIWVNQLDDECRDIYRNEYGHLWTFFQVIFWLMVINLCFFGLLLLVSLVEMCMKVCKRE